MNTNTHNKGFTLLEVMLALLIFAITGTAIMKSATDHLNGVSQIENITFATWVANNRLTQINIENSWPLKDNLKGEEKMAGTTWYWQQKLLSTPDESLIGIEIVVGTDENFDRTITSVTSYMAKPKSTIR
ncbi:MULTISPECIES: type II secretion system minor pseudopilin GspI [Alteromonadaceae]|uniref:type II secretion system minor pseudopilin GspI n=1 Tax=Alteromonadaceae TaxID=72275 RepID=UPI001C08545F|nr:MULTISPECIES: type II secretion system minor pseudopilin GspI [Aliiglaciecola]MBU2877527.1 type II secretion system minor pseudopilin GspI [Aliiglaciecola lipolytica]MDO6711107.1 type II secretion system minor pseudopilin GspI [Aliiglaciecola sp. 2_MG-2023]MDO6752021.1 type II secretion system minor pseudopilin GspI [Aliiglaciecola sp. 1_MG-2023]